MRNKKTTISGILTLLATIGNIVSAVMNGAPVDYNAAIIGITAGVGLLAAKDGNVTGGTVTQPTVANPPTLVEDKK